MKGKTLKAVVLSLVAAFAVLAMTVLLSFLNAARTPTVAMARAVTPVGAEPIGAVCAILGFAALIGGVILLAVTVIRFRRGEDSDGEDVPTDKK